MFLCLTLQQLQAGAASCADMADLVFCVPLGAAGGGVAPAWTQTQIVHDLKVKLQHPVKDLCLRPQVAFLF